MPSNLSEPVSDRVYVAQVLSLFSSVAASAIMAGIFIIAVAVAYERAGDPALIALGVAGCIANALRIAVSIMLRKLASVKTIIRAEASRFEALFALPYVGFAAVLGAFGFMIFQGSDPELHMLTVCVAVGYCAGVAANCGSRPVLALSSIVISIGPVIYMSSMRADHVYPAMAIVATLLIVGAARLMMVRFNESKTEIAARISSVTMARRDVLTSLPNRLALNEFFTGQSTSAAPETAFAVHYLDLDGFKPVNDRYGHSAGDELLIAVADRLRKAVRKNDMVARLGGDEFAVVQFALENEEEAASLSWRVRDAIQQPFEIKQSRVSITASVGTILSSNTSSTLDELLQLADANLYDVKRARQKLGLNRVSAP